MAAPHRTRRGVWIVITCAGALLIAFLALVPFLVVVQDKKASTSLAGSSAGTASIDAPAEIRAPSGDAGANLAFNSESPGVLSLVEKRSSALLASALSNSALLDSGATYRFPADSRPADGASFLAEPLIDGIVGPSHRIIGIETLLAPELTQTREIYRFTWETAIRFKPEVWIEGGYAAPPLARRHAHTWRLADDFPAFSHPYPFAGLLEQVTYAAVQEQLLGRRSHIGFIWGGEDKLAIQRQWLAAAIALQRQTILSTDLRAASPDTARTFREYLAALRPFVGMPSYGPGVPPESFAMTVEGTSYLALLNSSDQPRTVSVDLAGHGLAGASGGIAFDPASREVFRTDEILSAVVAPSSLRLLVLRGEPGVLWGDRDWETRWEGEELLVDSNATAANASRLWLYVPGASGLWVDGEDRAAGSTDVELIELSGSAARSVRVSFSSAR